MIKYIGQHIFDFIARFRNDIYLENIADGTVDSDKFLGLDSNGKVVKETVTSSSGDITAVTITTDSGGGSAASETSGSADFSILGSNGVGVTNSGTTITAQAVPGEIDHDSLNNFVAAEHYDWSSDISGTATVHTNNINDLHGAGVNGADNQILTDNGNGTIKSEPNLTWDSDSLTIQSSDTNDPNVIIKSTGGVAHIGGALKFITDEGDAGASGDILGRIEFVGDNADQDVPQQTYAKIFGKVDVATDGEESGILELQVANHDDDLGTGLTLTGGSQNDEIDVTVGLGSASTTTIAGNLNVNGEDHAFTSSTNNKPHVTLSCGGTAQVGAQLTFKRTATGSDNTDIGTIHFEGKNDADEDITYARINVDTADASDGAEEGEMVLSVASHDGELQSGLTIVSGNLEDEVDATIGNGANSLVTVPGKLSVGTRIDFDSTAITGIQTAAESFSDDDVSLMTSAAIDDRINAAGGGSSVTADPFSTTVIKVLPNQWVINDDAGRPLFVEDDTSNTLGVRCFTTTDEMYAWQKLPSGYKATHVQVHASASTSSAVSVRSYNYQTGADNAVSATTGDLNANIDITDIPSSATQDLVIKVSPASGSTIVYGATVTIATI